MVTPVRFLRRSTPSTVGADPTDTDVAQGPGDTSRSAGKGRPTPKRREAETRRRGPAPPPPRTQREASRLARANRPDKDQRRRDAAERRERMAAGDDRFLMPRDRGPVKAYIRDVVDSRPHLMGLFMPLAIIVCAVDGLSRVQADMGRLETGNLVRGLTLSMRESFSRFRHALPAHA